MHTQILFEHINLEIQELNNKIKNLKDVQGEDIEMLLYLLYELEYKLYIINHRSKFYGVPQRKENIKKMFEDTLKNVVLKLKDILYNVFEEWINLHDYENKNIFAKTRLEYIKNNYSTNNEDILENILAQFINHNNLTPVDIIVELYDNCFRDEINMAFDINDADELIEIVINNYDTRYKSDKEKIIAQFIKDANIFLDDDSFLCMLKSMHPFLFYNYSELENLYYKNKKILIELKQITNNSNLNNDIVIIQKAITAVHINGSILEYIDFEFGTYNLFDLLNKLSEGKDIDIWDKELEEMKFVIK